MEKLNIPCAKVINIGLDDTLLQNCASPDFDIRNQFGIQNDEIILLYVGRIVGYKKPFLACDILRAVLDKGIKCRMFMIGKGALQPKLLSYIEHQNLADSILYKESVPYSEMYRYMAASDCFINLSSIEIFGMTILEAMYYSLPVVAHVAPGPNDIIENGVNGYLCDSDDPEKWSEAILQALKRRNELANNAHNSIMKKYIWDNIADEFLSLM